MTKLVNPREFLRYLILLAEANIGVSINAILPIVIVRIGIVFLAMYLDGISMSNFTWQEVLF